MDKNELQTIDINQINEYILTDSILICYASFEERGARIPLSINCEKIRNAIVYRSKGNYDVEIYKVIKSHFREKIESVELDINKPVDAARTMTKVFKKIIESESEVNLVIDITTFTHETLLMMLRIIYNNKDSISSVKCLYNGADRYSEGEQLENVWLSKGCQDVRNVIGYHGIFRPSVPNILIILTGFEQERATRLVEIFEPNKLYLGCGKDPITPRNKEIMDFFKKKFVDWRKNFNPIDCEIFEFSCKDIEETVRILTKLTSKSDKFNYIIVPLNTKLSTIATALVALKNRRIQVCYSIPETYNYKNYSTPGNNVTIYSLI